MIAFFPRAALRAACLAGALLLGACATPPSPTAAAIASGTRGVLQVSGRLGLTIDAQPPQSFSAGFDLRGSAAAGELTLTSPLGNVLARVTWNGQGAVLSDGREPQRFATLDSLLERVTGAAIPAAALFDWMAGIDTPVPDWQSDLSRRADGRITARRLSQPPAELRVVFQDLPA